MGSKVFRKSLMKHAIDSFDLLNRIGRIKASVLEDSECFVVRCVGKVRGLAHDGLSCVLAAKVTGQEDANIVDCLSQDLDLRVAHDFAEPQREAQPPPGRCKD